MSPRLRRRTLLAVLAVAGLSGAFAISELRRRARRFRVRAAYHERLARMFARDIRAHEQAARANEAYGGDVPRWIAQEYHREAEAGAPFVEYHERLRRKYAAAAERPWRPVAPDPPEPELPP